MAFARQRGLVSPDKLAQISVAIIGTGSGGSFVALALTKMGVKKLILFDHDVVELHNVSNQYFTREYIGESKVLATAEECKRHSPERDLSILPRQEFYKNQPLDAHIVIALTDNIEGRAAAFEVAKQSPVTEFFIDGRMGGELLRIFALNPKDVSLRNKYQDHFLDGVKNSEEPCTARTIIYNVLMAASLISSYVKKWVVGEEMPFEFSFDIKSMNQVKSGENMK